MKILGIGVDIIKNSRIKKLIKNKSFISRNFGKKEIDFSKKKSTRLTFLQNDLLRKRLTLNYLILDLEMI